MALLSPPSMCASDGDGSGTHKHIDRRVDGWSWCRRSLTGFSWCSTSSTASLPFSSCTGSSSWLRAFIPPAPSKSCTANSRRPSAGAASVEWYVGTTGSSRVDRFKPPGSRDWSGSFPLKRRFNGFLMLPLCPPASLCSSRTSWEWPGSGFSASPRCPFSSSTTCGPPVQPWGPPWPTWPTSTPSALMFVSMVGGKKGCFSWFYHHSVCLCRNDAVCSYTVPACYSYGFLKYFQKESVV